MLKRVKQLMAAVTAKITLEDRRFIEQYLQGKEQPLFWAMNLPDQRHALNVAYTAQQLGSKHKHIDRNLLIKCALLHDVGKIKGDVSTIDKIMTVIGHTVAPNWAKHWGRLGRGSKLANCRHAFYIYFHHARRSAALLKTIGASSQMIEIISKHHQAPADDDPLELVLLRTSDELH